MAEINKFLNDLLPPILNDVFQKEENHYSLRNPRSLGKCTTLYGIMLSLSENFKFDKIFLKTLKFMIH